MSDNTNEFTVSLIGDLHICTPEAWAGHDGYDASSLALPNADLALGMGDWVEFGRDDGYEIAVRWAQKLSGDLALVRGNHDNGAWHRYARQVCLPSVAEQLAEHSQRERMGAVEWKPMVWVPIDGPIVNLPRQSEWNRFPEKVQGQIIKIRDLSPATYAFEAGGMRFICLDTSNWMLGDTQMCWLEQQVGTASSPVVLVGHHHFLPVDTVFDTCQVHERDFMRRLVLENRNIIAYLHGHAHQDCWWKYGHMDVLGIRNHACRTVTFCEGKVTGSILDGTVDSPEPFLPRYLCGQCMHPGKVACLEYDGFENPWGKDKTPCLAWLPPKDDPLEILWTMRLPAGATGGPASLKFQVRAEGATSLHVTAPGLNEPVCVDLNPLPHSQTVPVDIGPLTGGTIEATLRCSDGWGLVAMHAALESCGRTEIDVL